MGWARLGWRRSAGLGLPRAEREACFDFVVPSGSDLVRACGVAKASELSALPAQGLPITRGRGFERRSAQTGPAGGRHGASRQDMQIAISDVLSRHALDAAMRVRSVSHFIGIFIDQWSPRGIRILEGKHMPYIPEDHPLAWCARESIRSERDCWKESMNIMRMLAPGETVAVDLSCPREQWRLSGMLPLSRAKPALLPRGVANIKRKRVVKRVVPMGRVASDGWMEGGSRCSGEAAAASRDSRTR
ncbi:unnamed protein product [Prorocentrum cordatum]|uniref:Uncharacterized protein n=1 Tax=Prorocentrum cordatum TaxID=2364126 RepID=A0ABN9YG51_9DINO|nr:unnamed protein product [Polarella glacialis]|mmetsp:Transcript_53902/g.143633  ORF Transcript_53902/g.143633 Transcript_53902/m.143633 type:complete len:246 (-) Transcript_53902:56-793(-)